MYNLCLKNTNKLTSTPFIFPILNTSEGGELMHDKRNPALIRGDSESYEEYLERLREVVSKLEWQSEGHRMWYTHKNPYGCWICELLQICGLLIDDYQLLLQERLQSRKSRSKSRRRKDLKKPKSE